MAKDPAFLFYSKDWIEGTAEYMPEEKGVYIDLLCFQHQRGGIPNDTERLAKMVGLSVERFQKIWDVISIHFEPIGIPNGDRLVNRKLNEVMNERSEKGKINTITGTFASLLRKGNFDKKKYNYLKTNFKVENFINIPKENITERLTEWLNECLKSIEDGNGNENGNENIDKYSFISLEFKEIFFQWLSYKKTRKESYKDEKSIELCYKNLLKFSGNDIETARLIVEQSMSNNWAGLFELKQGTKLKANNKPVAKISTFDEFNGTN